MARHFLGLVAAGHFVCHRELHGGGVAPLAPASRQERRCLHRSSSLAHNRAGRSRTQGNARRHRCGTGEKFRRDKGHRVDRKSTRLNSSHLVISYAAFSLKKKRSRATYWPTSLMPSAAILVRPLPLLCSRTGPDHLNCYVSRSFFFLMIRRPPRSALFPTRRSSD